MVGSGRDMKKAKQPRPWWRRHLGAALSLLFAAAVIWLLVERGQTIEWREVWPAVRNYGPASVAGALLLGLGSYALCSCYDLFGKRHVGHDLPVPRVLAINFVGYAFSQNLGAMVGGMGFRYRLYDRYGLKPAQTTQVIALSIFTNWSGYLLLLGLVLSFWTPSLPRFPDPVWLRAGGIVALALVAAYAVLCIFAAGHERRFWRVRMRVPSAPMMILQLGLSSASWVLIAATVSRLLPEALPFSTTLSVVLLGSMAGALLHVPAGLGVLEAVFLAMLPEHNPAQVLAALLVYRMVYQLAPLGLAALVYMGLEWQARGRPEGRKAASQRPGRGQGKQLDHELRRAPPING